MSGYFILYLLEDNKFNLITILGPTASGKTSLAVALAKMLGGEIISADSRQVYRDMNIGTGKDLEEYGDIPYHLIDILDAGEIYGVGQFQKDFNRLFSDIRKRGKVPILCGGTGLYIQAVLQNFKHTYIPRNGELRDLLVDRNYPELKAFFEQLPKSQSFSADTSTHKRLIRAIEIAKWLETNEMQEELSAPPQSLTFGIEPGLETRRANISKRLHDRFEMGLIEEVKGLIEKGIPVDMLIFYGLEYKIITQHLQGDFDLAECFNRLEIAIHQFAKRQMTYFRKMEKDALKIQWLSQQTLQERLNYIERFLASS